MREILFKAKRKDNNEWTYGDLIQLYDGRRFIIDNKFGACIDDKGNFINTEKPFVNEVIPETICQYIGLTDKNGVKIFENDKCKIIYYDYENGYENSWGDMISEEIEKTIIIDFEFIYTFNFYGEYDEDSLEVIGSKFDSEVKE